MLVSGETIIAHALVLNSAITTLFEQVEHEQDHPKLTDTHISTNAWRLRDEWNCAPFQVSVSLHRAPDVE